MATATYDHPSNTEVEVQTLSQEIIDLTDEPEGGSSPVPLWLFRECFKYLAEIDCSEEQTFFDGKKLT